MFIFKIREALLKKYESASYMVQQKVFILFLLSFVLLFVIIPYSIADLIKFLISTENLNIFYTANIIFTIVGIFVTSTTIILIWKSKFTRASYLLTIYLTIGTCLIFLSGYNLYIETGFTNQGYFFFLILLLSIFFDSKKILIIMAIMFITSNTALYFIAKPYINPSVSERAIFYSFINSNIVILMGALILYLSITISNKSFERTDSELKKNRELTETLEIKVEERTLELQNANEQLSSLGNNLQRYLPPQLVESIIKGEKDSIVETERKKLTIFFSDIKGFTTTTDGMEPEELSSLLNEYLSEMTDIAHRWGGTVDKFVGDAIMIFFGAPESTNDKDHAVSCVKMAIEMQTCMKTLQEKWFNEGIEYPLEIRIGITTGVAAVGNFGAEHRLSYTAIGGQVNLASRLESICKPGEILISHPTYAMVKDEIKCRDLDPVQVKGIHREIRVYEVVMN